MPEIQQVPVQLRSPSGDDPGRVTVGFYIIEDGKLTMTDENGKPVRSPINGDPYVHRLRPEDNAAAIASVLTKRIRSALRGDDGDFNRRIEYSNAGIV